MTDTLPIRPAVVDDMETIIRMIDEAAAWLGTKGTDQWASPWPSQTARDARVLRGIRGGSTWIVEEHGEAVATITCRPQGNQEELLDRRGTARPRCLCFPAHREP